MNNQTNQYKFRINRVIDYIEKNIAKDMSLKELAKVANFSEYHFHRIFRAAIGETLNQFIQRLRIEKAANMLITNPNMSITEISITCGFSSSSVFSRNFKSAFGVSASEWKESVNSKIDQTKSNISKPESKTEQKIKVIHDYFDGNNSNQSWRLIMLDQKEVKVEIRELAEQSVAYVRHIGPYKQNVKLFEDLIGKLCTWAGPRGFLNENSKIMSVYHDDLNITDEDKLRLSICVNVPEDTKVDGEIGKMKIAGGKYACANFEINADEYEQAWEMVFKDWLPESGYQPDDNPCFELYLNDPKEHPEGKHIFDICVPVKPL